MVAVNALSIDVEDYFHVSAFESISPPSGWDGRRSRVETNTCKLLELLERHKVRATFFVLGWVAERFPAMVKRIADQGHEIASHGYLHQRVYTLTREEFREDVRRARSLLQDLTGTAVSGYRAPSYSIAQSCLWAFDELVDAGHSYDSSVFPIRHDLYGMPSWPRHAVEVERLDDGNWVPAERYRRAVRSTEKAGENGRSGVRIMEVPITTLRLGTISLPIAGGGYFRLLPYWFTRWGLGHINREEGKPFVFYLHPWELDPEQPRMEGAGLKSRFRHYVNLGKTMGRFAQLLSDFSFSTIQSTVLAGTSAR